MIQHISQDTTRAVERLTQTHVEIIDKHATTWPPLLTSLEDSVRDKIRRRDGSSSDVGVSIDFGMLGILDRIKRECSQIRATLYLPKTPDLLTAVNNVWQQAERMHLSNELNDAAIEHVSDKILAWELAIDAERGATTRKMELTVPCPSCGNRWILEQDQDERTRFDVSHPERNPDGIRKAAVVVEYAEGRAPVAECRVAGCEAI